MDDSNGRNGELPSSELGTKKHWDKVYAQELKNFSHHGDEGEVWFGEDSLNRIIRYLEQHESEIPKDSSILDLGCGNGITCLHLAAEGYTDVLGVDYSEKAIDLARDIAKKREIENITFEVGDILNVESCQVLSLKKFTCCLDKGTYDAVSLCPNDTTQKRQTFIKNVHNFLNKGGYFIITSCNWTSNELTEHFKDYFRVISVLPTPTFTFGGITGNMVTSIVFQKL